MIVRTNPNGISAEAFAKSEIIAFGKSYFLNKVESVVRFGQQLSVIGENLFSV